ncbi:MAG: hypothetical protein EXS51_04010 [Candidatus Taylorbacteria bacterium]|nr:hypothetical protein [Candidatus Taylorbacteria bacterium]
MMRKEKPVAGNYYHLYNRGVRQELIFLENADKIRFLFLLLYCQLPLPLSNNEYHSSIFEKHGSFYLHANREQISAALPHRRVELVNFCLMNNHFHLTVLAREDTGVSKYLQRVLNAYTKYFNIKHKKTGHLFEGPYQLVRVKGNDQLLHLSAYIHRNPRSIRELRGKESSYPFSSLSDYTLENRWDKLLKPGIILEQFKGGDDYKKFVETSSAKSIENKLAEEHLIEE